MRQDTFSNNYIMFNLELYDTKKDMFCDISVMLDILTKNNYQCAFEYEDCGMYRLDFGINDPELGSPMIYWLDEDQLDVLCAAIEETEKN